MLEHALLGVADARDHLRINGEEGVGRGALEGDGNDLVKLDED